MTKLHGFEKIRTPQQWKDRLYSSIEAEKPIITKHRRIPVIAAALLAVAVIFSGTALAISLGWHEQLMEYLKPNKEQIENLEVAVDMPEATVTHNGVTVTVKQTLADAFGIYVLYEMTVPETIKLDDNVQWIFSNLSVPVGETDEYVFVGTTGTTVLEQNGNKRTALIHKQVSAPLENGKIELLFRDLSYFDITQGAGPFLPLVEGEWKLGWDFTYVDTSRTVGLDLPISINGSKNTITQVIISPMSVCVYLTGDDIAGIVQPTVIFKDGNEISYDVKNRNASFPYYLSDADNEIYMNQLYYRFEKIVDPSDVAGIQIGDMVIPIN
jgi:hypothetical protein